MTDQPVADASTPPAAIPWYRSKVLVGLVTFVCAQLVSRVQAKYHVDLALFGINANDLASGVLDAISAAAVAYAAHGRVTQTAAPQITLTKAGAQAAAAATSSPTPPPDKPAGA